MGPYIFAVASVVAVLPLLFIFKLSIERVKDDPTMFSKVFTKFLIWVAIFETIPIILLIFAFAKGETVAQMSELYIPGLIIIITFSFAALFIFLQRMVDVDETSRENVQKFCFLAFAMTQPIPIISIIGLIIMLPSN